MTPEVRDRIDQIRQGIVPEGYKKTKSGILPESWSVRTIAECLERVEHPVEVQANEMYTQIGIRSHGKGLFYKEPVTGDSLGNKSVFWIEPDCFILNIVFAWEQAIGKTTQAEAGMIGSHRFPMYRPINGSIDIDYLISYLLTKRGTDILEAASPGGAGRNRTLGQDRFMKSRIVLPPLDEQQKIAEILSTQDKAIELQGRKIEELKRFKKGCLEKMFPRKGQKVPEKRFPGFTDDWEQKKFSSLYIKVNEKNDLSFGTDRIISVANMYFKADIKESSDEYLKTYNVMRLGDIAFEGNKSKNYAHGRFVENTIGDGIISHVFDVFRPIAEYDLQFWKYLINDEGIMGSILTRCTKASTMMTNLVAEDFLKETIAVPSLNEQRKIGMFLNRVDDYITLHQRKLEEMKRQKKALMQLLLTGIVRV